jgi:hypothetical protein
MTLQELTADITQANEWRLAGKINREEHADMIARMNRIMIGFGWTWADVEAEYAGGVKA